MMAPCETRFPGQIEKLLLGALPARKMRRLRAHLQGCPACQHRYNKIVLASRLFEGGPEALTVPSEGELLRVGEEVMRRVRLVPDARPARGAAVRWVAAVATCGVVLAIALPLVLRQERPLLPPFRAASENTAGAGPAHRGLDELRFQARGASGPATAQAVGERIGLRAFCIQRIAGLPQVSGLVPAEGAVPSCRTADVIKFAYTNHAQLGYLFLVGVDDKYAIKWYEPHPPERRSVKVKSGASDEPLARAVRLAVNHRPGQLRVFALFSARPIGAEQIEQAVAQARKRRTPLATLVELPVPGSLQQSLLLRLQP
jgi:hypothetical protein